MRHRFLSSALAELSEAAAFYDERVPGLGADFLDEVDAAVARVLQLPEAWSRMPLRKFT